MRRPPPPPILGEPDSEWEKTLPAILLPWLSLLFRLPQNWGRGGLLFLLFFLALPLHARPQVIVVLADHLTLSDVTRPGLPNLHRMEYGGVLALMSPGLAQKPDPVANVYATLGAGDTVRAGDISQGRMADSLRRAGVHTAIIGDADGDDTGPFRPALLLLPGPTVTADGGTAADATAPGGRHVDPAKLWAATQAALRTCDLVVVHFGDFARAERENQRGFLLPAAYRGHRGHALRRLDGFLGHTLSGFHGQVFVVVPTPPLTDGDGWDSLTPFLATDPHALATLTSDTTQTRGLIAARDIAPTILADLGVPAPLQMTGAEVTLTALPGERLVGLDRLTRLNQEAQNPIFWAVGLGAAIIVFANLGLYLAGRMVGLPGKIARYGLRVVSAWPLALLLAPLADIHTVSAYVAVFAGLTCLLALLPSPPLICALTALVIVGDGLTGTTLISNSALSEYALAGIRFYGIGNEYMGVLIGGALLACVAPPAPNSGGAGEEPGKEGAMNRAPIRPAPPELGAGGAVLLWLALAIFVLSFPSFGAKAGGAVTATATFFIAWRRLQGKVVNWKHLVGSIIAGFVLVFVWALLSHVLHLRRTHLETAVGALGQGRFGYIAGVSLRKIGLAARVALHPGTVLGLAAFGLLWLAARRFLWKRIGAYLSRHRRFDAVWGAGLWGCLVAVLFNDSGIVAAILMLQCLVLSLLHGLFLEERDAPARA